MDGPATPSGSFVLPKNSPSSESERPVMVYHVSSTKSRRTRIEIVLPIDINGHDVVDENDQPIKGATPIMLVLPRYNYISFDQLKELVQLGADIDKRDLTDDYTVMDRGRDSILAQLQPFVEPEVHQQLRTLTMGQLQEINDEWTRASNLPLGESSASNGSSRTTRRPSNTTSSEPVSASAT